MVGFPGLNLVTSIPATAAFGPGGGLIANYFTQSFSSAAYDLLQNLGERWGVPQSEIELAQANFSAHAGDAGGTRLNLSEAIGARGRELGVSPADIGRAQQQADLEFANLMNQISESDEVREIRSGRGRVSGPGWLRAMAEVLGRKLDELAHEMEDLANKVTKEDPSTSTDFSVVSQQFNMLMTTVSTALKTIGEALSKMASRQ